MAMVGQYWMGLGVSWHGLGLFSNRVGVEQASPLLCEDACWVEPNPMLSLHPRKISQASDGELHKAKEIQNCVGIFCDSFKEQFTALLSAIEAGKTVSVSPEELISARKKARELK